MWILYDLIFLLVLILALPYILLLALLGRERMAERLGLKLPTDIDGLSDKKLIWVHAASVGEISAAAALVSEIKKVRPELYVVVSTTTTTGLYRAKEIVYGGDLFMVAPFDFSPIVKRVIYRLRPMALVIIETEIWPNLIRAAKRRGSQVAIVSGRLSQKGFLRYRIARGWFSKILVLIDVVCVQSEGDKDRFTALGADKKRIKLTGNLKIDSLKVTSDARGKKCIRKDFGLLEDGKVLIAGSTRQGEEDIIVRVFEKLCRRFGDLSLIIAPRHLDRLKEVEEIVQTYNLPYLKWSDVVRSLRVEGSNSQVKYSVIILDTVGELASVYRLADVAFVGGSLMPLGGHNPLEPAAVGVPTIFGKYMDQEGAYMLLESGAALKVEDEDELLIALERLFEDEEERGRMGGAGIDAISKAQGVAPRTVELLVARGII